MTPALASAIATLLTVYGLVGLVFGVFFAFQGAGKLDPKVAGTSIGFRMLLLPGAAALWPLLLMRLVRGTSVPTERTAHKVKGAAR